MGVGAAVWDLLMVLGSSFPVDCSTKSAGTVSTATSSEAVAQKLAFAAILPSYSVDARQGVTCWNLAP